MKPACLRAETLLQRRAAGLSQAEGLQLEEHVAHCSDCRQTASMLSGLRAVHRASEPELSETARRRAIQRALDHTAQTANTAHAVHASSEHTGDERAPRASGRRVRWPVLGLAAACALLAVFEVRSRQLQQANAHPGIARVAPPAPPNPPTGDRVLSGSVDAAGSTHGVGEALAANTVLRASRGAQLALGHATVELRAETRAQWDPARRELRLDAGSVMVDVDAQKHQSFSVITERFSVRVLGTRFEVSLSGVKVLRGRVQVQTSASELPIVLDAARQSSFALQPSAAGPTMPPAPTTPYAPSAPAPNTEPARPVRTTASALLDRARAELAEHALGAARHDLQHALELAHTPNERAEALSLRAEASLVAGDFAGARTGYLRVAAQFPQLTAAETALFAAARIEAEHGQRAPATELLTRYLAHYPNGSFAREAHKRLQSLAASPAP